MQCPSPRHRSNIIFTTLKNFLKGQVTFVIVCKPMEFVSLTRKMWWMRYALESLKTLATSKKSFPKR